MSTRTIGWVVRTVADKTQVSCRFSNETFAHQFASNCAMPVRLWRVVRRARFSDGSLAPNKPPPRIEPPLFCATGCGRYAATASSMCDECWRSRNADPAVPK
jgi:hypothetical protein